MSIAMFAFRVLMCCGAAAQSVAFSDEEDTLSLLQIHAAQRHKEVRPYYASASENVDLGRFEPMTWPDEVQYPEIDIPVPIKILVWSFAGFLPETRTSQMGNCTVDFAGRDFKLHIPDSPDYDTSDADVVLFGLPNMMWDFPGNYILPRKKNSNQMWVTTCEEPYKRTGLPIDCRMMLDPPTMQLMDASSSYDMNSTIPVLIESVYAEDLRREPPDFSSTPSTELATIATSDCTSEWRNNWLKEMMAAINSTGHTVLSYGTCLHNADEPEDDHENGWINRGAARRFKLVAENTLQTWYVTEKIWDALAEGSVPVYLGPPEVKKMLPEGSFLYANDFPSTQALVQKMISFTSADFAKANAWRQKPTSQWGMWEKSWEMGRHTMMNRFCSYAAQQKVAGKPFKSGTTPSAHDLPCCPSDPSCCMNGKSLSASSASSAPHAQVPSPPAAKAPSAPSTPTGKVSSASSASSSAYGKVSSAHPSI